MANVNFEGTNLLGAPFKSYVDGQIAQRQTRLGKLTKDSQEIVWQNGKSAYVALASSVNIENTIFTTTTTKEMVDTSFTDEIQGISSKPQEASFANKALGTPTKTVTTTTTEIVEDGTKRLQKLNLSEDYLGNKLSNNVVLFGGTAYFEVNSSGSYSNPYYRSGIATSNSLLNNSAYGFGGTSFGLSAMPGITSFNIKSRNMGSLREASLTIRANNEEQFKLIDTLYCRIGYTMFIEWGNSIYFDNDGKYVSNPNAEGVTSLLPIFLSGKNGQKSISENPNDFLRLIEKRREKSNGNYDGFFGKVKNFSWEFNKAGYYEITLSLISQGDIIESLNIDGQYGTTATIGNAGDLQPQANNTSALTTFLTTAASPTKTTSTIVIPAQRGPGGSIPEQTITREEFKNFKTVLVPDVTNSKVLAGGVTGASFKPTVTNTTSSVASDTVPSLNYTRLESSVGKIVSGVATFAQEKPYFYIRLGDILDFIKDRLLVYNSEGNNEPILDIDTDTEKNMMYNSGINVSADPSKVMVRCDLPYLKGELETLRNNIDHKVKKKDWKWPVKTNTIFNYKDAKLEFWESKRDPNNPTNKNFPRHGKIMNIYFEYQYLLDVIKNLRNEETGTINLYDFVDELCKTANSCLGGVNKLTVRLEEDKILRIYDQNPIYGTQNVKNTVINLYGINPTLNSSGSVTKRDGSFVTDFNIKTELTNDFATQVTIGAQAQSNNVGEDSTGLSSWNSGLKDRFYPKKIDSLRKEGNVDTPTTEERIKKLTEQLKYLWLGYSEATITNVSNSSVLDYSSIKTLWFQHFPTDRYSEFIKLQKDWLQELIKLENEIFNKKKIKKSEQTLGTNQIGMIPINISITMEGISGIRIYDKLEVDTRFLPSYYPQTLIWIIKGVSHEIQNNKWYTKLETIAVPKIAEEQDFDEALGRKKKEEPKPAPEPTPTPSPSPEPTPQPSPPSPPTNGLVDVTWNYNNAVRRKIIDKYGWPIDVQVINGKYYAEPYKQDSAGRNLYRRSQTYLNNTTTTFEYKLTTFKTIKIKNINKDLVAPLTTVLDSIKAKNLSIGVVSIDAVIYPRDTTGKQNIGKLSGHSFGVALDVNAANFPYGNTGYKTYQDRLANGDLRAQVIKEFVDSGLFYWGGDYKNTKDAHHFSLRSLGSAI